MDCMSVRDCGIERITASMLVTWMGTVDKFRILKVCRLF